ncbi:hypothetical protein HDV00_006309 [Rhizophlyctis rosea]|nr:hypothetical protein HDV00_006309 [Rhizophlyctis rosea]
MSSSPSTPPKVPSSRLYDTWGTTKRKTRRRAEANAIHLPTSSIYYTQPTIKNSFTDGTPVTTTITQLQCGELEPEDLPLIRVRQVEEGKWKTLDNRRLYCFKEAKVEKVWCEDVTGVGSLELEFVYKDQSANGGVSVEVVEKDPWYHW